MYNTDMPSRAELPSSRKLIRSTLLAAVAATALMVTVVLPAEYAIDPTGAGRLLGLTEMGEIKEQLAEEAALDRANAESESMQGASVAVTPEVEVNEVTAETTANQTATTAAPVQEETEVPQPDATWRDEVQFTLSPGEGVEYKLTMTEGDVASFAWKSERGAINFDTHGDGGGNAISYEKGRGVPEDEGDLEAAFTGNHGWFFRNRNDSDVTVVLRIDGDYENLKRML